MPILVIDRIEPKNAGEFPVVEDSYFQGGFRSVNTYTEMTSITSSRRKTGMFVFNNDDSKLYRLSSDLTTWVEFAQGGLPPASVGQILQYKSGGWSTIALNSLYGASDSVISLENGDLSRSITLRGQSAISGNNVGGDVIISGGSGIGIGSGGNVKIRGGSSGSSSGSVSIGDSNTSNIYFGDGVNGIQYNSSSQVLNAIGSGSLNLVTSSNRLRINGTAITGTGVTASNFNALFDGSIVTSHSHASGASGEIWSQYNNASYAQHLVVYRGITSAANSWTEIFLDGISTTFPIVNDSILTIEALYSARETSTNLVASYRYTAVITRDTGIGTVSVRNSVKEILFNTIGVNTDVDITPDTINGNFNIRVKSNNSNTCRWTVALRISEVKY